MRGENFIDSDKTHCESFKVFVFYKEPKKIEDILLISSLTRDTVLIRKTAENNIFRYISRIEGSVLLATSLCFYSLGKYPALSLFYQEPVFRVYRIYFCWLIW